MKNNEQYFCNRDCRFYPCHEGEGEDFNCLFCYCPLYALGDRCGGDFLYLANGIKSCENCTRPHDPDGYAFVLSRIGEVTEMAKM